MDKIPVLILGGGVAGLAAALDLSRRGVPSVIAERSAQPGGQTARFCCKATESCARCGACRLGDLLAQTAARPEITLLTQAMAVAAEQVEGFWQVDLAPQAGKTLPGQLGSPLAEKITLRAGAVILAVGYTPFNPQRKSRFGFGRVGGVTTAAELERTLALGQVPQADKIAFIQCVGSRDRSLGHLYCSRVCCGFALRLARLIKHNSPETEITFFHMDVQNYGRAWEDELAAMREDIRFVRAMPGEVTAGEDGPEIWFAGPDGSPQSEEFGLVALSQGMGAPMATSGLVEMFGGTQTLDGFLGLDNDLCAGGAPGVFIAGAARGPRSIVESIDHAGAAAGAAALYVGQNSGEAAHA